MNEIEAWARELAAMKPLEPALYEPAECAEFLEDWVAACGDASQLLDALGPAAEEFFNVATYSVMDVVWRDDLPLPLCQRAIESSLPMIAALCERNGPTMVTGSFWMVVIRRWCASYGQDAGHRLLPTVKATLLEQLKLSRGTRCLRDSAWEGIKLIDEEVAAEAQAIEAAAGQ